jgi:hypothetical protein
MKNRSSTISNVGTIALTVALGMCFSLTAQAASKPMRGQPAHIVKLPSPPKPTPPQQKLPIYGSTGVNQEHAAPAP